jgi:hypothetical protein
MEFLGGAAWPCAGGGDLPFWQKQTVEEQPEKKIVHEPRVR